MYIQTNDKYPIESQRNKKIHVPRSVAEVSIYRGEATLAPKPAYGSKEWVEERQALDANRPAQPGDTVVGKAGIEWGVQDKGLYSWSKVLVIKRLSSGEIFYLDGPPADCPESIKRRYYELVGPLLSNEERERLERECSVQRAQEKIQAHRDLHQLVKDQTVKDCSFGFTCDDDDWTDEKDEQGRSYVLRTVKRGKLLDVSLVLSPAYSDGATMAQARSLAYQFNAQPQQRKSFEQILFEQGHPYTYKPPVVNVDDELRARAAAYGEEIRQSDIKDPSCRAVKLVQTANGPRFFRDYERERAMGPDFGDFSEEGRLNILRAINERYGATGAGPGDAGFGPRSEDGGQVSDPQQSLRCPADSVSSSREDHGKAVEHHRNLARRAKTMSDGADHFARADAHDQCARDGGYVNACIRRKITAMEMVS